MNSFAHTLSTAWSLLWRSTVLAPAFFVCYVLGLTSWIARFFLPLLIVAAAYTGNWAAAGLYGLGWAASVTLWRWKRFRGLLESPPSLL